MYIKNAYNKSINTPYIIINKFFKITKYKVEEKDGETTYIFNILIVNS